MYIDIYRFIFDNIGAFYDTRNPSSLFMRVRGNCFINNLKAERYIKQWAYVFNKFYIKSSFTISMNDDLQTLAF